ncbi:MAG: YIP1 family protein [Thermoanaerobaculia bacterium]|nr:YIP1 family protein [Thermoanaerobaculia bacterium]MCZ7650814.1 YIP1 family protein [Thermoanaerobaculia bacterium]
MTDNSWTRLPGALVAPRKTFGAIAERPTVLVALLLATLLGAAVIFASFERISPQELLRSVEASGRQLPPELDAARLHRFSLWSTVVGVLLASPLVTAVAAALLLAGIRLGGGEIDYRRALSVTVHGLLPFTLAGLLTLPVVLARQSIGIEELQGGTLLLSSLAAFAPEGAGPALVALLASVDLFSVWCLALLVLGFQIVARVSRTTASVAVGVVWALGVAVKVGMAALR